MLQRLPLEISQLILSQNPPWTLPTVSLVCRFWQVLVFPILYRTLFFEYYEPTKLLVDRINGETEQSAFRISICVRNLLVNLDPYPADFDSDETGDESEEYSFKHLIDLRETERAILKFRNLQKAYWGSDWLHGRPQTLLRIQKFTKLHSIDLQFGTDDLTKPEAQQLFALQNLKRISISISKSHYLHGNSGSDTSRGAETNAVLGLLQVLRASPALEELSLLLLRTYSEHGVTSTWSPVDVVEALATDHFPRLRVLKISCSWLPHYPIIEHFLANHPNLHTLE
ncbi:hypothetical protein FRC07_005446, partial [Ceratobasidium sp. 392]